MVISGQLPVVAGLVALVLGTSALLNDPRRLRHRLFALLCATLAIWNLFATRYSGLWLDRLARPEVFLIGSCFAAPVGLHLVLELTGRGGMLRRVGLPVAYLSAVLLYASAWPWHHVQPAWSWAALIVTGTIAGVALLVLARHVASLPRGHERSAFGLLLIGAVIGALGGLSDFVPRVVGGMPEVGSLAVIVFLVVVCGLVLRYRFLDVHVYLARAVLQLAGAALAALLLYAVVRAYGPRFLPLLLACLVILLVVSSRPARSLLSGARNVVRSYRLSRTLMATSRDLQRAQSAEEVAGIVRSGRQVLPGDMEMSLYLWDDDAARYRVAPSGKLDVATSSEARPSPAELAESSPLVRLLAAEGEPLTRRAVAEAARLAPFREPEDASDMKRQMDALDAELLVPLFSGRRLGGWVAVGGGNPRDYLSAEAAAALLAVGSQAMASLERIRATERARQRETLAAVGELAAGLAHEVRNPVAAIRGAAEAIPADTLGEDSRDMLEIINEETTRLGRFVGEFLDYARPGSPRREPVALDELAQRVARAAKIAGTSMEVEVRVADGLPAVSGDPERLRRVFENVVRNAVEACGDGGRMTIDLSLANEDADANSQSREGKRVEVRFRDNGPGIPEDGLDKLFQPFFTTRSDGTGLGLALAQRIVADHDGELTASSPPGGGALFTLRLHALGNDA